MNKVGEQSAPPGKRGRVVRLVQKTLGWSLLALLVVALLLLLTLSWIALTESGTRWAVQRASSYLPPELSYGEVQGKLASPLILHDLRFQSDGVQLLIGKVSLEWYLADLLDMRLRVERLAVQDLDLRLSASESETDRQPLALPELPLEIELQKVEVRALTIVTEPDAQPLFIDEISASALWDDQQLALTDLVLRSQLADLDANATLVFPVGLQALTRTDGPARLSASILQVGARYRLQLPAMAPLKGEAKVDGPISDLSLALNAQAPYGIALQGSLLDVLTRWRTDLQFEITRARLGEISGDWPEAEVGYAARVTGGASELLINGSGTVAAEGQGRYESSLELVYSPLRVRIVNAAFSEQGAADPLRLRASGLVELSGTDPMIDLAATWQRLRWPLLAAPTISSRQGELTLTGTLAAYTARLNADLAVPNQADGDIKLLGSGSDQHFETETLTLSTLNGEVQGSVSLHWREGLQILAKLTLEGIDPSGLAPEWPGAVDAEAQLQVSQAGSSAPLRFDIESLQLGGSLRDAALQGNLALSYDGDRLEVRRGQLALGENEFSLSGQAAKTIDMAYELKAPNLATLWPGSAGGIVASGTVTGRRATPIAKAQVQVNDLAFAGRRLRSASLSAELGLDPKYDNRLRLTAQEYQDATLSLSDATVQLQGSQSDHRISLVLDSDQGQVQLALIGHIGDLRRLNRDSERYDFTFDQLQLRRAEYAPWLLQEGGGGSISASAANLDRTCLLSNDAQLCLTGDWRRDAAGTVNLTLAAIPLERANAWLPPELRLQGQISGNGTVSVEPSSLRADLKFDTTQIELFADADTAEEIGDPTEPTANVATPIATFEPGQVRLLAEPQQPVRVDLRLPLAGGGGLSANLIVEPNVESFADSGLTGAVQASLPDVSFIGELVPEVSRLKGALRSELSLAGRLGEPIITGLLRFSEGEATLIGPDITLKDIDVSISGTDPGNGEPVPLTVDTRLRSGDGPLTLTGQVLYSTDAVDADLTLKGERFRMMNNEQAEVYASPDLQVSMRGQMLRLRGTVAIPEADIALKRLPESAVVVSDDQILISEDENEQPAGRYSYSAAVTLALGDAVQFKGFGLDARFTGDLRVKQTSGEPALGNGEIRINDGRYQAYGQDLKIETGRAIWTDSPLSEPGIDLRAIRNPRPDVTVGVRARGLLAKPEFSLFSEPSMSESDQLSYLVLGRPLVDNSSAETSLLAQAALALGIRGGNFLSDQFGGALGVDQIGIETEAGSGNDSAAFVVGKYLSPKLYVSYGLGLLDSVSTLKLEYLLSSKWRLVTESSTIDSGGDVIYTIERD